MAKPSPARRRAVMCMPAASRRGMQASVSRGYWHLKAVANSIAAHLLRPRHATEMRRARAYLPRNPHQSEKSFQRNQAQPLAHEIGRYRVARKYIIMFSGGDSVMAACPVRRPHTSNRGESRQSPPCECCISLARDRWRCASRRSRSNAERGAITLKPSVASHKTCRPSA